MKLKNTLPVALALVMLAGGCAKDKKSASGENAQTEETRNMRFVSYSYNWIAEKEDSTFTTDIPGSRYVAYSGEGVLPELIGDDNVTHLRDSLQRLAGIEFADDDRPSPVVGEGERLTDLPVSTEACGAVDSRMNASLVNPRVVVFEHTASYYECGAAHGMSTVTCLNYFIDQGKILTLNDIVRPEAERKLLEMVRKGIKAQDVTLEMPLEEVPLPDEWMITATGLEFVYQPYDIAPYSEGVIKVPVKLGALMMEGLLTAEGNLVFNGRK